MIQLKVRLTKDELEKYLDRKEVKLEYIIK